MNSLRWRLSFSQSKASRPVKIIWQDYAQVIITLVSFRVDIKFDNQKIVDISLVILLR